MKYFSNPLTSLLILVTQACLAQKPNLITDRPDQTDTPYLIPVGALQVETGFTLDRDQINGTTTTRVAFNSTMVKYGISDKLEFRLASEYLGEFTNNSETTTTRNGMSPITMGIKIKLGSQNGFWEQAGLITQIKLRTGSKGFSPTYTATSLRATFSSNFSEKLTLDYNVGLEWDGETPEAIMLATASLNYSFHKKLTVFFEGFTFLREYGSTESRVDSGITYLVAPLIQVDLMGGIGLCKNSPNYFLGSGISFRFLK